MTKQLMQTIKNYYSLTKPGVLYGNVLTALAGFLLASAGSINFALLAATILGTTCIIASACTVNNYLDQDIDRHMERTKKRVLVQGLIKPLHALLFGIIIGGVGVVILALFTNMLVVASGVFGFVVYVWLYGAWSKRQSIHGTAMGSVSGAVPIFAGYVAVSNQINAGAIVAFLIMFFWQFPEFYAIAIYRRKEYKAAGVPVITVVKGVPTAIRHIAVYTVLFVISTLLLTPLGYTGYTYAVVMGLFGFRWLQIAFQGFSAKDSVAWSRHMFKFSMVVVLVLCIALSLGPVLP